MEGNGGNGGVLVSDEGAVAQLEGRTVLGNKRGGYKTSGGGRIEGVDQSLPAAVRGPFSLWRRQSLTSQEPLAS